jgi:hypothetical protein
MPPPRSSGRSADATTRALGAASAMLGIQLARSLYGRWRRLPAGSRGGIERLAEDVKQRALDLRGELDPEPAGRELRIASERLADAIVDTAAADPDASEIEVRDLRAELANELERLAEGDVRASRGPGSRARGSGAAADDKA